MQILWNGISAGGLQWKKLVERVKYDGESVNVCLVEVCQKQMETTESGGNGEFERNNILTEKKRVSQWFRNSCYWPFIRLYTIFAATSYPTQMTFFFKEGLN